MYMYIYIYIYIYTYIYTYIHIYIYVISRGANRGDKASETAAAGRGSKRACIDTIQSALSGRSNPLHPRLESYVVSLQLRVSSSRVRLLLYVYVSTCD